MSSETGSRLPTGPANCISPGASYTKEDLERTGQPSVGPALRTLDASLVVH